MSQVRDRIKVTLAEFLVNLDVAEAARCLAELAMPFYHHEFVKQAVELAFEKVNAPLALDELNMAME